MGVDEAGEDQLTRRVNHPAVPRGQGGAELDDLVPVHPQIGPLRAVRQDQDAEDAVQDTLLSYLQHAPEFESRESERSWLLTVAATRCRDSLRRAKRHPSVSMDELTELGATDEHALVLDALMALPEKFRRAQ